MMNNLLKSNNNLFFICIKIYINIVMFMKKKFKINYSLTTNLLSIFFFLLSIDVIDEIAF